jgi:hypothetical protein
MRSACIQCTSTSCAYLLGEICITKPLRDIVCCGSRGIEHALISVDRMEDAATQLTTSGVDILNWRIVEWRSVKGVTGRPPEVVGRSNCVLHFWKFVDSMLFGWYPVCGPACDPIWPYRTPSVLLLCVISMDRGRRWGFRPAIRQVNYKLAMCGSGGFRRLEGCKRVGKRSAA